MGFVAKTSLNIISKAAEDIEREGSKRVMQAARYVRKQIVANLKANYPKRSGNLFNGVAAEGREGNIRQSKNKAYAIIGMTAPAYHAGILESGTKQRVVKNAFGRKGVKMNVGKVTGKHTVMNTFEKEKDAVEQILSGQWVA